MGLQTVYDYTLPRQAHSPRHGHVHHAYGRKTDQA